MYIRISKSICVCVCVCVFISKSICIYVCVCMRIKLYLPIKNYNILLSLNVPPCICMYLAFGYIPYGLCNSKRVTVSRKIAFLRAYIPRLLSTNVPPYNHRIFQVKMRRTQAS